MKFSLVDRVLHVSDDRLVAVKLVSLAEEYLQDHFPTFPVLPGVFMLESLSQAARELLGRRLGPSGRRHVLAEVRALKYGAFVTPGDTMRLDVTLTGIDDGNVASFRAVATVFRPHELHALTADLGIASQHAAKPDGAEPTGSMNADPDGSSRPVTCASGRLVLRPVRPIASPGRVVSRVGSTTRQHSPT